MRSLFVLCISLFIASCSNEHIAQDENHKDTLQVTYRTFTRDTHNLFPSRMYITGKVVHYSPAVPCGRTCTSAQLKIELLKEVGGYTRKYVYIAAPCYTAPEDQLLDKIISMEARKIAMDDTSCYFTYTSGDILNTGILPWYQPYENYVVEGDTVRF